LGTFRQSCPQGYHLPSDDEWKSLESFIGMDEDELDINYNRNSGTVGRLLKTDGGLSFDADYVGLLNSAGNRLYPDIKACFWTATQNGDKYSWSRIIDKTKDGIDRLPNSKEFKLSVRCVKAAEAEEAQPEKPKEVRPDKPSRPKTR